MSFTLDELATLLEADLSGDGAYRVLRCGKVETAGPGVLVVLDRIQQAGACTASGAAVITAAELPAIEDDPLNVLVCDKPRVHFHAVNRLLKAQEDLGAQFGSVAIAESALVHRTARLAQGCVIQHGARVDAHVLLFPGVIVEQNAHVGPGCIVRSGAVIGPDAVLGPMCEIGSGSVIGAEPQQFEAAEGVWTRQIDRTRVRLGKRVVVGANSVLESGARRETIIESDVLIGGQVYISHDCHIEEGVLIIGQSGLASGVHVGPAAALMARVAVDVDIDIGAGAFVLATAGVTKDVPPGARVWGNPARSRIDALRRASRSKRSSDPLEEPVD